jgi:hypothetical protein
MSETAPMPMPAGERADLLETLGKHRSLLRHTVEGLTDEQARLRPTVSELSLGGLIKHVSATESAWADFIVIGPAAMAGPDPADPNADWSAWQNGFLLLPGETLAGVLEDYAGVAARTDGLVRSLPDLDAAQPLPVAPWFPPGVSWSARRVFLHIVAETSQHAGHADILRESIDGQKSMG